MRYRFIHCLCLLLLIPALTSAAPPLGIPDGWSDGYVYANGVRLHYYRAVPAPGKPVIVMVHGVTDIGLSWTTLTSKLQPSYDIYMLDARGHGLSDPLTPGDDGNTLVKGRGGVRARDTTEAWQAMSGTMATGNSLGTIPVPTLILKADASPDVRKANEEAATVLKQGRLVHIDGAGHNLHHDELQRTLDVLTPFLSSL